MIDLHTHSLMSDGVLLPSELVRRAEVAGYRYWAITDHADQSNLDHIVPRLAAVAEELNRFNQIQLLPGIELTHVPPETIAPLAERARRLGARLIVVHGETIAEPVPPGTNRAAILAGVHLLAHPGLISAEEVRLAAERGVYLEVTSRKGHSLTNGHVVRLAREEGALLVLDSDTHEPGDIVSLPQRERIVRGAGLEAGALERMDRAAVALFERLSGAGQRSEDGGQTEIRGRREDGSREKRQRTEDRRKREATGGNRRGNGGIMERWEMGENTLIGATRRVRLRS